MSTQFWALVGAVVIGLLLGTAGNENAGQKIERTGMTLAGVGVIVILALAGVGLYAAVQLQALGFNVFELAAQ